MGKAFSRLRAMLSERGTSERWWRAVELVLGGGEETALLQEYLVAHVSQDESWRGCRVPCGDWGPEHPGHSLCERQTRAVEGLPDAVEVYCPPGTFRMGSSRREGRSQERPAREVTLTRGFWVLSTPVTQAMFETVTGKNPACFKGTKRPVENVDWYDAMRFCDKLSEKVGRKPAYQFEREEWLRWLQDADGYRLPTEAEWEYFCRAGSSSPRYGNLEEVAWYKKNSGSETLPVALKEPNAWGLFDTLGNVREWCVDEWDRMSYRKLPQVDPVYLPQRDLKRVLRGGSWKGSADSARASSRVWDIALSAHPSIGFRFVRTHSLEANS